MGEGRTRVYLLNIGDYAPAITAITYPMIYYWAEQRLGADVEVITTRAFPEWPIPYEKLQIHARAKAAGITWAIYVDSDALVHPETPDFTEHLPMDTVAHHGADPAMIRWRYDDYFRRDGRGIGSCNWFTMASRWCLDLWRPLDDLTPAQAVAQIRPTINELTTVIDAEHLVDDYALSRNISRFGLKFTTIQELLPRLGLTNANLFWHAYTDPIETKVRHMDVVLHGRPGDPATECTAPPCQRHWHLPKAIEHYEG